MLIYLQYIYIYFGCFMGDFCLFFLISQARQAMQEQLAQNKELTKKVTPASESEEEEDVGDDPEAEKDLVPDVVNERHIGMASSNPWMLGKSPAESQEKPNLPTEDSEESEEEGEEPLMANEKDPSQGSDGQWQSLKCQQGKAGLQGELPKYPEKL